MKRYFKGLNFAIFLRIPSIVSTHTRVLSLIIGTPHANYPHKIPSFETNPTKKNVVLTRKTNFM